MSVNSGVVKTKERHLSKTKNSNSTWQEKRVALASFFLFQQKCLGYIVFLVKIA